MKIKALQGIYGYLRLFLSYPQYFPVEGQGGYSRKMPTLRLAQGKL